MIQTACAPLVKDYVTTFPIETIKSNSYILSSVLWFLLGLIGTQGFRNPEKLFNISKILDLSKTWCVNTMCQ